MSFTMYMGLITGMIAGLIVAGIAMVIAKKRGVVAIVEEDERTEQIRTRAGNMTMWAVVGFSFVGWVTDNVLRNGKGQPVAFFSPWSIILFASVAIYLIATAYENWKVSDPDAVPDDAEMKKLQFVLGSMGASVMMIASATSSAGDRLDPSIRYFLMGVVLLMTLGIGVVFGLAIRKRKQMKA